MSMIVTPVIAGILVLAQIPLTLLVGYRRLKTDIRFLDGGDETLIRRMRTHGNFTETVPSTLIAMALAEINGMPVWALWLFGTTLVAGRAVHAAQILSTGWGLGRSSGMGLTFLAMLAFGGWCLWSGTAISTR
ncbi:MAPEG family protein [Mesorhizobium sp. ZMM04-5]|uniref:MAPEG family protein n=1 Tax=Mesorhizobium marinum TaxID=3228790 RepID=A0ABV3R473_9HYPH